MYVVKGKLDAEVGAVLMRAVEAAMDALFCRESRDETSPEQRRADAVGLVAERALAGGFGASDGGESGDNADGGGPGGDGPVSGTRAERYQVLLHVERGTLEEDGELGMSELEDGTRVSAETSRRISCDASVICVTRGGQRGTAGAERGGPEGADGGVGSASVASRDPLHLGRRIRTVSPALRRALEIRDRGCRFPGCGLRFTDAHHLRHWADGGETSLVNCILLCRFHHRLVHEDGWTIRWEGETSTFLDPRGRAHLGPGVRCRVNGRAMDLPRHLVDSLIAENRLRAIEPDERTAGARWRSPDEVPAQVRSRAEEAM